MYVELQLSAQDVTELQRKQDLRAVNIDTSRTDMPPTSQTFTSAPGSSSSQFSPQRPRTHFNSKDCTSLSENTTRTQTCYDQFCPSHSSPGRTLASVCPHHSCSQQSGCLLSSSSAESPMPASIEKVCFVSFFTKSNDTQINYVCIIFVLLAVWCSDFISSGANQAARSHHRKFCQPLSRFLLRDIFWWVCILAWGSWHLSGWKQSQKLIFNAQVLYPFFSLLLSGTLASSPQSSISQHQHGVAIILQILDDLLKAPYRHQGPPPAPSGLHSPISNTEEEQSKAESKTVTEKQKNDQLRSTSGELYNYTELYFMVNFRWILPFLYLCRWVAVTFNHPGESNAAFQAKAAAGYDASEAPAKAESQEKPNLNTSPIPTTSLSSLTCWLTDVLTVMASERKQL